MDKYLFSYAAPSDPPVKRGLIRLVEKATGQAEAQAALCRQPALSRALTRASGRPRCGRWRSTCAMTRHALAAIPKTGPVVVVANHPYGVLDGIVISWLVSKVRAGFRRADQCGADARARRCATTSCRSTFPRREEAQAINLAVARRGAARNSSAAGSWWSFPGRRGVDGAGQASAGKPAVDARWQPFVSAADPAFAGDRRADLVRRSEQPAVPDRQPRQLQPAPLADLP